MSACTSSEGYFGNSCAISITTLLSPPHLPFTRGGTSNALPPICMPRRAINPKIKRWYYTKAAWFICITQGPITLLNLILKPSYDEDVLIFVCLVQFYKTTRIFSLEKKTRMGDAWLVHTRMASFTLAKRDGPIYRQCHHWSTRQTPRGMFPDFCGRSLELRIFPI